MKQKFAYQWYLTEEVPVTARPKVSHVLVGYLILNTFIVLSVLPAAKLTHISPVYSQ